jgi:hypothetical protein
VVEKDVVQTAGAEPPAHEMRVHVEPWHFGQGMFEIVDQVPWSHGRYSWIKEMDQALWCRRHAGIFRGKRDACTTRAANRLGA